MKQILAIIAGIVVLTAVITAILLYKPPAERLRLTFLAECNAGHQDTITYITALQQSNSEHCQRISDQNTRAFCKAEVTHNAETCAEITLPPLAQYCRTLVSRDPDNCNNDPGCLALVTSDVSLCDKLDSANRNECKALVLKDATLLDNLCEQISYVLAKKTTGDPSWCDKVTDPELKTDCVS